MKMNRSLLGTAVLLAGCITSAHAAVVGTLTCTAETKQLQVNLSHFNFGATVGTSSTVTYQLLNVHAALSQFGPFYESVNKKISSCELKATLSDGTVADFKFTGISLNSARAVARSPRTSTDQAALFTDATFAYTSMKVVSAGGADDGGTDGGWYTPVVTGGTGPTDPGQQ